MGPTERVPSSYWLEQLKNTIINTAVRAFQTKNVFWSRMPHCAGPAISACRNLYKHNSRAASINALMANDIHNYIKKNNYSKIIIIPQKWKYLYIYNIYIYILHELTICWKRCQRARANNCHRYRLREYDMLFLFIYFMGVYHTHMQPFVIYYSWSFEIILHVWIWRSGNPVLQYCLYRDGVVITVTPHERLDVSYHQSLDCLFKSMSWLITKQTSTLSHWRCICNTEIAFCSIVFTVTQHGRHDVSNHRSTNWFR